MRTPYIDPYWPIGKQEYIRNFGWNFNRRACEYAVSGMKRRNPATGRVERFEPYTKEKAEELLKKHGVTLEHNELYNFVYVLNMGIADFLKSSIVDDAHLALFVKDVIDDPDNPGGNVFRKWYADEIEKGNHIEWDDFL